MSYIISGVTRNAALVSIPDIAALDKLSGERIWKRNGGRRVVPFP